ncbi:glutathione-S-transferase theta, GST [Hypoxylon argillaceum]|nr:glutathione-S-transferase theta, GST [Hypoxylon argillaceum]
MELQAAAGGLDMSEFTVIPRKNLNKDVLLEKFPRSSGKIPALESPAVRLTETIAIAVYLARVSGSNALLGDASPEQEAEVLSWVSWANQELLGTLAKWFLPLIPNFLVPAPYDYDSVEEGKRASLSMLKTLETSLGNHTYLVGSGVTLADIFLSVVLSRGLEWVLDETWRSRHPNCMRHFDMMRRWGPVQRVIPEFKLIEKETPNLHPVQRT